MSFGSVADILAIVFLTPAMTSRAFEPAACESIIAAAAPPFSLEFIL